MGKGHVLCEGVICDFQKLPLLTDLINVKCASPGVPKQTYFETNGAVDRCQNILSIFCALFTDRHRSNTSTNQKLFCICWYVTIWGAGDCSSNFSRKVFDFFLRFSPFFAIFTSLLSHTLPPSSTNLGQRENKKMFWRQFVARDSHLFNYQACWMRWHKWDRYFKISKRSLKKI